MRVATHFLDEDDEALQKELKEAFRLYDKEGKIIVRYYYGKIFFKQVYSILAMIFKLSKRI